jgi:hypothetical protein
MADDVWREFFDSYTTQYMNEWEIMVVMRKPTA